MKCRIIPNALPLVIFVFCLTLCSCGDSSPVSTPTGSPAASSKVSTVKGSWDNSPNVLIPSAPGTVVFSCDTAALDVSNISDGYITVDYHGDNQKVKLQVTGPNNVTYTFDIHGGLEVFPLVAGNGSYTIGIYENIEGTQYASILSQDIQASISNEFGPYLYPNQYVNFSTDTLAVQKGSELAYCCNSDIEVVESVYNYIISNVTYDYEKASTVKSGYIPDIDRVYTENSGICFDYASLMAAMLRTQSIPTRLEIGYIGEEYHAWISTYINNVGWINGIIEFDGSNWNMLDPTFASTSASPKDFIANSNDYITKYIY